MGHKALEINEKEMRSGKGMFLNLRAKNVKNKLNIKNISFEEKFFYETIEGAQENLLVPASDRDERLIDQIRVIYFLIYPQLNPAPHIFKSLKFDAWGIPSVSQSLQILYERLALRRTDISDQEYSSYGELVKLDNLIRQTSFIKSLDLSTIQDSDLMLLPKQAEVCYSIENEDLVLVSNNQSQIFLKSYMVCCDENTRHYLNLVLAVMQDCLSFIESLVGTRNDPADIMLDLQLLDHFAIWNPVMCRQAFEKSPDSLAQLLCALKQKVYAWGFGLKFFQSYVSSCLVKEPGQLSQYQWLLICEVFRFVGCNETEKNIFEFVSKTEVPIALRSIISLYFHLLYREGSDHFLTTWFRNKICSEGRRPRIRKKVRRGNLRVGIVSADLKSHAVSSFVEPLFFNSMISKHVFFNGQIDRCSEPWVAMSDEWIDTKKHTAQELTAELNKKNLDVIVDLGGVVPGSVFKSLHDVMVPIIGYIGGTGSNGSTYQDYFVIDKAIDKEIVGEQFSEELLELPTPWMRYNPHKPMPNASTKKLGSPVIGVINDPRKVGEKSLILIKQILESDPDVRILFRHVYLSEPYADAIRRNLCLTSDQMNRVIFDNTFKSWTEHMDVYNRIWMTLDPCDHYGGGTSTCDSLFMGCPCVYVEGDTFVRRMTKSFNVGVGMSDFNLSRDASAHDVLGLLDRAKSLRNRSFVDFVRNDSRLADTGGAILEIQRLFERVVA